MLRDTARVRRKKKRESGLYKTLKARALSHLCLSLAVCVCVGEVMVMVLLGRSGLWDASFYARGPGSISDHFNGQEHRGAVTTLWVGTNASTHTCAFLIAPPTMKGEVDAILLNLGPLFHSSRALGGVALTHCPVTPQHCVTKIREPCECILEKLSYSVTGSLVLNPP